MELDDDARLADPALDQYFLSSPEKLALLVRAAAIRPTDDVVEVGAGIGSVARALPESASLTLIELDERFAAKLRRNAPHARIILADSLEVLPRIPCDVLLSNLPRVPTARLLPLLPGLTMRTAIVATGEDPDLSGVAGDFDAEIVTAVAGPDFKPPQPATSLLVKLSRRVRTA